MSLYLEEKNIETALLLAAAAEGVCSRRPPPKGWGLQWLGQDICEAGRAAAAAAAAVKLRGAGWGAEGAAGL